jgi:putative ATPase
LINSLFSNDSIIPLAERVRPKTIDDFVGQEHILGNDGILKKLLKQNKLVSMIFWGPPGVGKTTLAMLLAKAVSKEFIAVSAINTGVKELRDIIEKSKKINATVLFIDEIHRFNKNQQDALLGAVERGEIILIGATTENPFFEVNSALLSRCHVLPLHPLSHQDLEKIFYHAILKDPYLKQEKIEVKEIDLLLDYSNGDARKLLTILELTIEAQKNSNSVVIDNKSIRELLQTKIFLYDKKGENHYDIISAFIKSIRGSDPHAAVYWLARMIVAGEDLKFIARRMIILASEDIGNANPDALVIATSTFQAIDVVGNPESEIILTQCAIYLACSPKSNSAYLAIYKAKKIVNETGNLPVPFHLRNSPSQMMKDWGCGEGYNYVHDYPNNFIQQQYMPDKLKNLKIYEPQLNAKEIEFKKILDNIWKNWYY